MNKILIMGIGNVLMGDEGIGVHVVKWLEEHSPLQNVDYLDGGTGSFYLLEHFHNYEKVILIDATMDGKAPGTVTVLKPKFSSDYPITLSAHDIGLKDLLDALYFSGKQPDITLFAVTIQELGEVTLNLTPELKEKIPHIAEQVVQYVRTLQEKSKE